MNSTGDSRNEEDANQQACYTAANLAGLPLSLADECENCQYACPTCPWRAK